MAKSNGEMVVSYAMRFLRRIYGERAGCVLMEIGSADAAPIDINCNLDRSEKTNILKQFIQTTRCSIRVKAIALKPG
jgi:hypothetical protein